MRIVVPYLNNEQADAATKNVHLKLLFRLCKFVVRNEGQSGIFGG